MAVKFLVNTHQLTLIFRLTSTQRGKNAHPHIQLILKECKSYFVLSMIIYLSFNPYHICIIDLKDCQIRFTWLFN